MVSGNNKNIPTHEPWSSWHENSCFGCSIVEITKAFVVFPTKAAVGQSLEGEGKNEQDEQPLG